MNGDATGIPLDRIRFRRIEVDMDVMNTVNKSEIVDTMKTKTTEKQTEIKTEQREIAPKEAGAILDEHFARIEKGAFRQRPVTQSIVVKYVADIQAGKWLLTPQPIAFDVQGNLIDGQHRLEAIRRANMPATLMVSTGWPVGDNGELSVIDVIDSGKPRTVQQILHMHGMNYTVATCAVLRAITRVAHNGGAGALSVAAARAMLEKAEIVNGIDRIRAQSASPGYGARDYTGRVFGPIVYYHTAKPKKAEEFASNLFNFEVQKGTAVQVLLNWQKNRAPGTHISNYIFAMCSALRAWDANETDMQVLKPTREAVAWLANLNPKLRDFLRQNTPRTR